METLTDWWQLNIEALAQSRPALYQQIRDCRPEAAGHLVRTAAGFVNLLYATDDRQTLSAYRHDNPWQDVEDHLATVPPESHGLVVFIGMGLGYGPLHILRQRPSVPQMVILEPSTDLFCLALHALDLRPLLVSDKIQFFVGDIDMKVLEEAVGRIAALEDTHILRHPPSFSWNSPLYGSLNDRAYMLLNQLNAAGGTTRKCGRIFFHNRFDNLSLLRHCHTLDLLKGIAQGRPAILVAAGPSLDRSLPELKAAQGRCLLIAADSALAPLLRAGIMPDFVTSIDYLDLNFEKLTPFLDRDWPFSLVAMIKSTPLVPKRFPARHLFLAFPEDRPHDWIVEALGIKTLAPACSSVAHLSLGLALIMGAEPIFFVGQDLGYTTLTGDHASGTIIMRQDLPQDREIFQVAAIGGGTVATDRQLLSLKKQFEDIIAETPRAYFNASAAGVMIDGAPAMELTTATARYLHERFAVGGLLDQAVSSHPPVPVAAFVKACLKNIRHMDKIQAGLRETLDLARQAKRQLGDLQRQGRAILSFSGLPAALARQLAKFDKRNSALDGEDSFWVQVLELTFEILSENDRLRERTQQIREQKGYLTWLLAEIERIDAVNQCRAESIATFRQRLAGLSHHLQREESLLQEKAGDTASEASLRLARLYVDAGDLVAARPLLAGLLRNEPSAGEPLLLAGEVQAGMLNYEAANHAWGLAAEKTPALAPRLTELRQRYAREWLGAADRYANATEGGDNFPHLLPVWLGRVGAIMDTDQQVLTELAALWQKHAGRLDSWLIAEDWPPFEVVLKGWQVVADRLPGVHFYRARYAAARHDHQAALTAINEALALKPDEPQWLAFAARELLALNRFEEGIARLQEAIALDRSTATLWEEIGDRLSREGDLAGAIMAFERCYLVLPGHLAVLCKMGDCYLSGNQPEAAIAAFTAALSIDPAHEAARQGLAKAEGLGV